MKKLVAVFISFCVCLTTVGAMAALQVTKASSSKSSGSAAVGGVTTTGNGIKKASAVKQQEKSGIESVTSGSLVSGMVGLVTNVAALAKQQRELDAECVPTSSDLEFVNELVKEYAKIADVKDGESMLSNMCGDNATYTDDVQSTKPYKQESCSATKFEKKSKSGYVWDSFPYAETATYCADADTANCPSSKKKTVSNIYVIFNQIRFDEEDFTATEASKYQKFKEKLDKCAPEKVLSNKKEAYVGLVKNAISGAGQKTNTATVWDAVGTLTQSASGGGMSGLSGGIQSLMPAVTGFLDK